MVTQPTPAGLSSDDLGSGGIFDALLTIIDANYVVTKFDSGNVFGAKFIYGTEDGNQAEWSYNVGDASSWSASTDGKTALGVREGQKISGNAAFGFWLKEIETAGFPKNRKTASLSCFIGTQFQSHGLVPPGQNMEGAARKAVLVAKQVVKLPGEVVAATAAIPAGMPTPPMTIPTMITPPMAVAELPVTPQTPSNNGVVSAFDLALQMGDSFTLPELMTKVMALYPDAAQGSAAAGQVFMPEFEQQLVSAGYQVDPNSRQVTKV